MSELEKLVEDLGITIVCEYGAKNPNPEFKDGHGYTCTLYAKDKRRKLTVDFYQGAAHTSDPSAADVLYCVCSDANFGEMDFTTFCSELGYSDDSISALKIHKACQKVAPRVRKFLGENFDAVASAEH
jgi:hypothetical protein